MCCTGPVEPLRYALVDCNNFYVSCERVFNPQLRNRPLAVLSNNDGCIVARSPELKQQGVPMGAPWFQWRARIEAAGGMALSSNYALYGDLSRRVMEVLETVFSSVEVYSIDEAFVCLDGIGPARSEHLCRLVRERIGRWTGIPVSVGLGPTRTLAKLANRFAKQDSVCGGVAVYTPEMLERAPAGDLWGIGPARAALLKREGIFSAAQLAALPDAKVRRLLTVCGLQTVYELRGCPALDHRAALEQEAGAAGRRSLVSSRSFGVPVTELPQAAEAVADYAARAAYRLRRLGLLAEAVTVFIATDRFRAEAGSYRNSATAVFGEATGSTLRLLPVCRRLLERIWRDGYAYRKAGVMLTGLTAFSGWQPGLFSDGGCRERDMKLLSAVDALTGRYGRNTVYFASQGRERRWEMRRMQLSPRYTTDWQELPVAD